MDNGTHPACQLHKGANIQDSIQDFSSPSPNDASKYKRSGRYARVANILVVDALLQCQQGPSALDQFIHTCVRAAQNMVSLSLLTFALAGFPVATYAAVPSISGFTLTWSDDFIGTANSLPNTANWIIDTGTSYPGGPANWGMFFLLLTLPYVPKVS